MARCQVSEQIRIRRGLSLWFSHTQNIEAEEGLFEDKTSSQVGYIKMNAYGGICVYAINTQVSCFDRSLKAPLYVVTDIR